LSDPLPCKLQIQKQTTKIQIAFKNSKVANERPEQTPEIKPTRLQIQTHIKAGEA